MANGVTIFHNPRCSKSRQTLQLLRDRGLEPTVIEYLKTPPSRDQVAAILDMLGDPSHALLRTKEAPYRELGLGPDSSKAEIAAAIVEHPILLERPVVVHGDRARIGRPPETVLEIL